ncbi:hypothetical protein SDC9_202615 [bioreactor metagenome]|uniref:Uncharacterized protein n=1 Tax=bioreactor metagenome TaxID=1076179 RepID=A0A645IUU4_9ZZZZ
MSESPVPAGEGLPLLAATFSQALKDSARTRIRANAVKRLNQVFMSQVPPKFSTRVSQRKTCIHWLSIRQIATERITARLQFLKNSLRFQVSPDSGTRRTNRIEAAPVAVPVTREDSSRGGR